jgi:hypothetical protein
MASTPQSDNQYAVDPEDELTKPEVRPALRAPASTGLPPAAAPPPAAAASIDDEEEEVTKVDPKRQQLVSSDPLPPDLIDLD